MNLIFLIVYSFKIKVMAEDVNSLGGSISYV